MRLPSFCTALRIEKKVTTCYEFYREILQLEMNQRKEDFMTGKD